MFRSIQSRFVARTAIIVGIAVLAAGASVPAAGAAVAHRYPANTVRALHRPEAVNVPALQRPPVVAAAALPRPGPQTSMQLSPAAGPACSIVTVRGSLTIPSPAVMASQQVGILFGEVPVATTWTDELGGFSAQFTVPALASPGWTRITAIGRYSHESSFAGFYVTRLGSTCN